jgi:hypothetical protein
MRDRRLATSMVLAALLCACPGPRSAPEPVAPPSPVEQALRAAASGAAVPPDFAVTYSDMHGMHGGMRVSLSADGTYSWQTYSHQAGPSQAEGRVPEQAVRDVIALLVQLRAWEQVTPPRQPVPDESRASLQIRAAGEEAMTWEWFNDMGVNNRLIQVSSRLAGLRSQVPPSAAPGP